MVVLICQCLKGKVHLKIKILTITQPYFVPDFIPQNSFRTLFIHAIICHIMKAHQGFQALKGVIQLS